MAMISSFQSSTTLGNFAMSCTDQVARFAVRTGVPQLCRWLGLSLLLTVAAMAADTTLPTGPVSGGVYPASGASGNIFTTSGADNTTTVASGVTVTLHATSTITLSPGFRANTGSSFTAQLYNAPTIAVSPAAAPSTVTGTSTMLSITGADDLAETQLTYTWNVVTKPAGSSPVIAGNGTNAAKSALTTFNLIGTYTFTCTISDSVVPSPLTVTSAVVTVTVTPTLTAITVAPSTVNVNPTQTQQFTATCKDQFNQAYSVTPLWTVTGGGQITTAGLFTPVTAPGGPYTISATSGATVGTASVTIVAMTVPSTTISVPASTTVYRNSDTTGGMTTSVAYTWSGTSNRVATAVTTAPSVSTGQNGSGAATTSKVGYDAWGRPQWSCDQDGYFSYAGYDPLTGGVRCQVVDANPALITGSALPAGWTVIAGTRLHLKTSVTLDNLGRPTMITDPAGQVTWNVYKDATYEVRTYRGWTGTQATAPIEVMREDRARNYRERLTMRTTPTLSGAQPTGGEAIVGAVLQSFERENLDDNYRVVGRDRYVDASTVSYDALSNPVLGASFEHTTIGYDNRGRADRYVDPTGTITRTRYDTLSRPVSTWSGLGTADSTWSDTNSGTMIQRSALTYDAGLGGGNSALTSSVVYADASTTYTTSATYDFRNRQLTSRGPDAVLTRMVYDHLSRVTLREVYANGGTDGSYTTANLRAASAMSYDERGQVYRTTATEVNASTGATGTVLTTDSWYNARGLPVKVKSPAGLLTKTVYDSARRAVSVSRGVDAAESLYADALTTTNDTLADQVTTIYDLASRPVCVTSLQRKDNDVGTGNLPTSTAFRQVQATWYDLVNRPLALVNYGRDNGTTGYIYDSSGVLKLTGGVPTVVTLAVPPRGNAEYQVTTWAYDLAASGAWATATRVTDALGRITETQLDLAGRPRTVIENWADGAVGVAEYASDRTTIFTYRADGELDSRTAKVPNGAAVVDQKTQYVAASTIDAHWVTHTIYPDAQGVTVTGTTVTGTDCEKVDYDRLGRIISRTDQRGVVHDYTFDSAGRALADKASATPSPVDGTVKRIERGYDDLSRVTTVSSYDALSAGTVLDQVKQTYGGYGQVLTSAQSHAAAVVAGTPKVSYTYQVNDSNVATGAAQYVRLVATTYPTTTRAVYRTYPTAGLGYALNRVSDLTDDAGGTSVHANYTYLGAGTALQVRQTAIGVTNSFGTGAVSTNSLDRFGRPLEHIWANTSSAILSAAFYTYDNANRRLTRTSSLSGQDEAYTYDSLDRLSKVNRGTVTAGTIADTASTWQQRWTVGVTNAWQQFVVDTDGGAGSTAALTQTRTSNKANEIDTDDNHVNLPGASISGTGMAWPAPVYDAAGSMISGPKPIDTTKRQHYTYDAWGRMTRVSLDGADDADTATAANTPGSQIAVYRYDGLNRRIVTAFTTYTTKVTQGVSTTTSSTTTDDSYYNEQYQEVEVRRNGGASAYEQYVYDLRYVDAPLKRYRSTANNGSLNEIIAYLNDARWNVTAITNGTGVVVERYRYDPYGLRTALDAAGAAIAGNVSAYDNRVGFTGRKLDVLTGLWYFRARYFDSALGQFISRDPLGYVDGSSLYCGYFVGNGYDPFGLCKKEPQLGDGFAFADETNAQEDGIDFEEPDTGAGPGGFPRESVSRRGPYNPWDESRKLWDESEFGKDVNNVMNDPGWDALAALPPFALARLLAAERAAVAEAELFDAANNVADFERYKDALRAAMGKPHTQNLELTELMNDLYRPGAKVGTGSTADAVRSELLGFGPTGGKEHMQKAFDYTRALENWLKSNPTANPGDRAAAENVLRDLSNAAAGN